MVSGFWSLSLMPFAKAISMSFTAPLFATLLAAVVLKERVRALGLAEVSLVVTYDYVRLLFAAVIGYFAFQELPGPHTWIGSAIIVGSGIYIARREAQLHQSAAARAVAVSADPISTPPKP
jgi:drug/metabolite transporter (DMT)-like permease